MTIPRINSFQVSRILVMLAFAYFAIRIIASVYAERGWAGCWGAPYFVMIAYGLWAFMGGLTKQPKDDEDNQLEIL